MVFSLRTPKGVLVKEREDKDAFIVYRPFSRAFSKVLTYLKVSSE